MLIVPNNMVACQPFGSLTPEVVGKDTGFARAKHKTTLVSTKVIFPPVYDPQKPQLNPGDTVYLQGRVATLDWVRNVFTVKDGDADVQFILVPLTEIQLIDNQYPYLGVGAATPVSPGFQFKLT